MEKRERKFIAHNILFEEPLQGKATILFYLVYECMFFIYTSKYIHNV